MGHWLVDHLSVFGDIALLWVGPVLLIAILGRLLRLPHRGIAEASLPMPAPLAARSAEKFEKRSAA